MPRLPPQISGDSGKQPVSPEDHLKQTARIKELDELGCGEWTTLYEYQSDESGSRCIYSALMSKEPLAEKIGEQVSRARGLIDAGIFITQPSYKVFQLLDWE